MAEQTGPGGAGDLGPELSGASVACGEGPEPAVLTVARVLPDVAGFEKELDYLVPAELAAELRAGALVRAPLQGRVVRAWVLAYPVPPVAELSLRPLAKVIGWGPEPAVVDLAAWAAWRWAGRRRSLLVTASGDVAVKSLGLSHRSAGAAFAPPPGDRVGQEARLLVDEAWSAGTHLMRLSPAHGATEVVLGAAAHGPVLVVAATSSRAVAGCAALRRRGADVALLPSEWARARTGTDVVIGARGAVWGPCPGIASIVVLDAHDEGLVQEQAPTWDAPSVAAERARRAGVPCFWVTPCPTLELVSAADEIHVTSRATERSGWAGLRVVDRRGCDPRTGLYSSELVDELRGGKGRVVCVLNRKGRALLLDCAACGEVARCEHCAGAMRLTVGELRCRHCDRSRPVVCAACGSDALRSLRVGVTRAREQLEALAGRPVAEVAAGAKEGLAAAAVLVGTEAVLFRDSELRRSGGVEVVAFLDFDQELLAPRYRASEEALALLARASRLVGGRGAPGRVLVQTRLPDHPAIQAALLADPARLTAAEEPVRRALRLPPFAAIAILSGPGAAATAGALTTPGDSAVAAAGGEGGAAPGPAGETGKTPFGVEVSELAGGEWAVRAPDYAALADALAGLERPPERVRVEVGPVRF